MNSIDNTTLASLPIIGRYSIDGDIELLASRKGMFELAGILSSQNHAATYKLISPALLNLEPYTNSLKELIIVITDEFVDIALKVDTLIISGNGEKLKILADNIEWLAKQIDAEDGLNHLHIDYHPSHYYLASSAKPLVLIVTKDLDKLNT